jgi:hypothetical protein
MSWPANVCPRFLNHGPNSTLSLTTSPLPRAIDSSLHQFTRAEHMTVFLASGDCGACTTRRYGDLSVSFPTSDPWVTAVGGTILTPTAQTGVPMKWYGLWEALHVSSQQKVESLAQPLARSMGYACTSRCPLLS